MKQSLTLLCLVMGISWLSAQTTFTVSTVSFRIDTLGSPEQVDKAMKIFNRYPEIKDFDLKGNSCDLTFRQGNNQPDDLIYQLKLAGFRISNLIIRANQTFTTVPVNTHPPKKEITEEEAIRLKEKGMLPKE